MIRQPVVAGKFYASDPSECARDLEACIPERVELVEPLAQLCGAIVPHAGWSCSGRVTGKALRALADHASPQTVVLMGAVHAVADKQACVFERGAWDTPLGRVCVDEAIADKILESCDLAVADSRVHAREHSLEVQVPFIQKLMPAAAIVPIMVPPSDESAEIGTLVGRALARQEKTIVVIGTTDLTHYGAEYGLTKPGTGQEGLDWAKNENDRRMIELILAMNSSAIVPEAARHRNACGAGAVAATIAACAELGATRAVLVEHTTSAETLKDIMPGPATSAVGYGGFVFGSLQ